MTLAINKFQKVKVFLSAKGSHIGVPSIYQNIVFSETVWPIELKFHMKTPYDKLAKIYTNCSGDMSKMADMPASYMVKTFKNLLQNQKADNLGTWYETFGM